MVKNIFNRQYIKTTVISLLSIFAYPLFLELGIIKKMNFLRIVERVVFTLFYMPAGILTGALWFMPFFSLALIIYTIEKKIQDSRWRVIVCILLGFGGLLLVYLKAPNIYYLNFALAVQPILFLGELGKKYIPKYKSLPIQYHLIICFCSSLLISAINYFSGNEIEFSKEKIYGVWGFYPMVFVGIIFCLSLASIMKGHIAANIFAFLGKSSFVIMALHFQTFKIVDLVMKRFIEDSDITNFPVSYPQIGVRIAYFIIGLAAPSVIAIVYNEIRLKYRSINK